jgi:hypothetical protein
LFCLFISVLLLEIQLSEVEGWDVISQFNSVTFISVLLLEIQLSEVEGWDVINQFNSATMFAPVQSQYLDFQTYVMVFLCSIVWGERQLFLLLI